MSTRDYVPGKAPPPVAERPKCAWCDTPLRPVIMHDWERRQHGTLGNFFEVPINRRWTGGYDSYGNFCKQGVRRQLRQRRAPRRLSQEGDLT